MLFEVSVCIGMLDVGCSVRSVNEIAVVSSLIEKGLLYVSVLLDLKFNGLFSA